MTRGGFTLIEVMVVMLIIGALATALSLSMRPDSHRQLEDEAYRTARTLEQAIDASEQGAGLALSWQRERMTLLRRTASNGWREVDDDDLLRPRIWPPGIHGEVLRAVPPAGPWLLWQDNQSPALVLSLHGASRRLDLHLSPLGQVEVREGAT